ncbi:MAG TPA: RNB domain-containing ribonuclease [Nocardioidaceae bacterium]|nr:RNB domain-containing ribonuclease [Nocardioidaceae bacterium]
MTVTRQVVHVHHANGSDLRKGVEAIQAELGVTPDFPDDVEAAAAQAARNPRLPELDRTDIPLVTIDPATALDLDQAMYLERDGDGYTVHYAIADVAAFVSPGDPIDLEANRRGETLYGADSKIPLHPPVLSEKAASLLPDEVRPALLWTMRVDSSGEGTDAVVQRALVRSRAKLDYDSVQQQVNSGTADEMFTLLREVGELRIRREEERGGVSLALADQEIDIDGDRWSLSFRQLHPVEQWNAQISLLTGMAAAGLMIYARVGLLRTLPPADPREVRRLHRTAKALGIEWPAEQLYPDFVRSLDPAHPEHAAMIVASTRLLRGAGYVGFNGAVPEQAEHSALASEYAHVTAPLRRLVDRYALEICVALCAGTEVPDWVISKLGELPATMQASGQRAGQYENAILGLVEAEVLRNAVGQTFDGVVVAVDDQDPRKGDVVVQQPAIGAPVTSADELPLGASVRVRLVQADPATRSVRFEIA